MCGPFAPVSYVSANVFLHILFKVYFIPTVKKDSIWQGSVKHNGAFDWSRYTCAEGLLSGTPKPVSVSVLGSRNKPKTSRRKAKRG